MKAAVCREFGKPLAVEELELGQPGTGEVLVKLAACAVCHSDIHYLDGAWGGATPVVLGHEAAGVVVKTGDQVRTVKPGDSVVVTLIRSCGGCFYCDQADYTNCTGDFALKRRRLLLDRQGERVRQGLNTAAFAEAVVVDQSQLVAIDDAVPPECAALLACGVITGLGAVTNTARVPPGSSVVVIGTGGVGLNSVQGAVLCGANTIIAADLADAKLEAALRFGATHGVHAQKEDLADDVRAHTGGRGADYVFVTVGSTKAVEQGLGLLRRGGTLVIVGMPPSGAFAAFEPVNLADAGQRILGSKMGSTRLRVDVPRLVALYRQGRLKLDELITGRFPLEDINQAIDSARRGEALRNVIVFGK